MDERDHLREEKLKSALQTCRIGKLLYCYRTLTRTMTTARELLEAQHPRSFDGGIVVAETVNAAKGRLGRVWSADTGGLWFSITMQSREDNPDIYSLMAGIPVCEALRAQTGCKLRWINDVMVNDKKLCGILIEAFAARNSRQYLQIGVGLNVNNTPPADIPAISLEQATGRKTDLDDLLVNILQGYDHYISLCRRRPDVIVDQWRALSDTLGRSVVYHPTPDLKNGYEVRALDITSDGALIVRRNGKTETLRTGEIRYCR